MSDGPEVGGVVMAPRSAGSTGWAMSGGSPAAGACGADWGWTVRWPSPAASLSTADWAAKVGGGELVAAGNSAVRGSLASGSGDTGPDATGGSTAGACDWMAGAG